MSKADMLGDSPTFNAVAQPMSSRAASFARFAGQDGPSPELAAAAQAGTLRVPLEALAHNPYNPREELKSVDDLADSLTARGVIQPLAVVTRQAFLAAHPDHEDQIGQAAYVVVDGNRRLAASNLAGLDDVPVHVDDSLAQDADTLLETALTAAVQHENLDPLDEAKALQRLVHVHGSQRAVARALGKSSPWVTQRIALLKLTPELQDAVEDRSLPVEIARNVGQLPAQQQQSAVEEALAKRAETKRRKRTMQGANAVSTPPSASAASNTESGDPENQEQPAEPAAGPTPHLVDIRSLPRVPWHDGNGVADLIFEKMSESQREVLLERLLAAHGEG
ncbi:MULTISPECIES: ParB/RepB/Spo0J family partition protein [unclassified Streptomyces]|uniref:ParB/RepB/Spo0J family partition protein n=1 Tax=unclassified Streptomyces TaxID=2593676 RepID=UPI001BE9631F|nr:MULTISPECIES: ParB/RepB/Spo0J family partition protein [unclassified Streptomyces]MBT2406218.1 ParB/RepB/Spo0J family partition protein [Streptomyces sp. ISL-21]MBT2612989.1 ParB/RepB/Spo0J family partition protein [Streptomyces sp. ISL-87]